MRRKTIVLKALVVLAVLLMVSAPTVMAQEPCYGDFDCDGDVMQSDIANFKASMGRWAGVNPCPTCQYNPCNCYVEVPRTGQTTCYDEPGTPRSCTGTGEDGEYKKGVVWPNPRFTANVDNNGDGDCDDFGDGETCDGTETDNLTGLIWLKDANCFGTRTWANALIDCNTLNNGECGLTDGSSAGDWRLPNSDELASLVHKGYYNPALPNTAGTGQWSAGDPFDNVQSSWYWSSTTAEWDPLYAWYVQISGGVVYYGYNKTTHFYVWPVRGGQ